MWREAKKQLLGDKYIGPLIKKYGDCDLKIRREKDYFEHLCVSILNQQLSGKVANVIYERFKKCVGEIKPENVIKTNEQSMRDCGMSWAKVASIKDLAKKTKSGELQTKKLPHLSDDEVRKELVAVKGIGNWTAEMFLMFTLNRPDIFPSDDLGIKNGMKKITKKEMTKIQMEKFSERWKPFRTFASWYIWRNLDNKA